MKDSQQNQNKDFGRIFNALLTCTLIILCSIMLYKGYLDIDNYYVDCDQDFALQKVTSEQYEDYLKNLQYNANEIKLKKVLEE